MKTHRPKGAFVQLPSAEVLHTLLLRALDQEISGVEKFLNLRKCREGMTAAEAAERATDDDLQQLEACPAKLEAAAEQSDREALDAADVVFHLAMSGPRTIRCS